MQTHMMSRKPNQRGLAFVLVFGMIISLGAAPAIYRDSARFIAQEARHQNNIQQQDCVQPPVGMVSWWAGEGNTNDIRDGNAGTAYGTVSFVPGIVGQAFSFDGTNGRINVPDSENLKIPDSLSIETWIFVIAFPGSTQIAQILFRGDERSFYDPYYFAVNSNGTLRFHIETLTSSIENLDTPIPAGQWVHVAATLDGAAGLMRLYEDGVVVEETTTAVRPFRDLDPSYNPGIGIGNHGGYPASIHNQPFHGYIDELSLYSRALSQQEIQSVFTAGVAGKCKSPLLTDLDGDAIPDLWESSGYDANGDGVIDVDLPAMGASPTHKDIFVEVDYMEDTVCALGKCIVAHSHRPNLDAINDVVQAFRDAPVGNIDGVHGINLHVDFGSDTPMTPGKNWGSFSRSNPLPHSERLNEVEFVAFKQDPVNFDPARQRIFHYTIFAHFLGGYPACTSGNSFRAPNADFVVTLGGWGDWRPYTESECVSDFVGWRATGTRLQQAGTFMHELGHNLGLEHGGNDIVRGKPNYLSVMNYAFQTRGLIYDGIDGGMVDYSRTNLTPPLIEQQLNEAAGLNGGSATSAYGTRWTCPNNTLTYTLSANNPIDWDCDSGIDLTNVSVNLNLAWEPQSPNNETLGTFFDWASLSFGGGGQLGVGADLSLVTAKVAASIILTDELTLAMDNLIPDAYEVAVIGPGGYFGMPSATTNYTVTVANLGLNADVYTITVTSTLGWANSTSAPMAITLAPSETYDIAIPVTIPLTATTADTDILRVVATSNVNPNMWSSHFVRTDVLNTLYLPLVRK